MKRRVRKIVNFFAFNLLFFALYLNFIHKDKTAMAGAGNMAGQQNTPAFSGTVLVETPGQPKNATVTPAQPAVQKSQPEDNGTALKLSIN